MPLSVDTSGNCNENSSDGDFVAGVYPLFQDSTCRFLAIDFDGDDWSSDATAYLETCHASERHGGARSFAIRRGRPRLDLLLRTRSGETGPSTWLVPPDRDDGAASEIGFARMTDFSHRKTPCHSADSAM